MVRLAVEDIDLIQAERDYMRLHIGARSYLLHQTIAALEVRLDPEQFIRIHRSTIVRRDRPAEAWYAGRVKRRDAWRRRFSRRPVLCKGRADDGCALTPTAHPRLTQGRGFTARRGQLLRRAGIGNCKLRLPFRRCERG